MNKKKLIRVATLATSLGGLLKGQLNFLNHHFEVLGVAHGRGALGEVGEKEQIRTFEIPMQRSIAIWDDLKALLQFVRLFAHEHPYIVHSNTPKASLLSMIAAWIARVPHRIYTVTGLRFETTTGTFRLLLKAMERLTCFFATKVIPEGEGVKEMLISERITQKPLHKILNGNINGVDLAFFDRTPEISEKALEIRASIGDSAKIFIFGFVGRLVKDKGINELVRAFVRFYAQNHDTCLLLVGSFERELDPLLPETENLIASCPAIHAVGYQADVRAYYTAFDALVFPSYREGFPNVVLQAGAMGLPSIVTNVSGCNEIIIEGENGIIIPSQDEEALFDAMKSFVEERNVRLPLMASNARKLIADRFEQSAVWQATLDMYNSLMEKKY